MNLRKAFVGSSIALLLAGNAWAVDQNEVDDFEDGTVENWQQGSPTGQPTNEANGGPGGAGDNYLQTVSTGMGGPGTRMVVFNNMQWGGDYNALGNEVIITMMLANFGAVDMSIRVGVEGPPEIPMEGGGGGPQWVTTNAFALPADGVWRQASFTLSTSEMTDVSPVVLEGSSLDLVLDDVIQFRVLSAASVQWRGDSIAATLGMDDISITQVPVELQSFSID